MISSRRIEDLDPDAQSVCREHLRLCRDAGIELIVTSTYRDFPSQDALYAIGRTIELNRKPVTKARGGRSWHNYRAAYDVVPIVSGKPVWNAKDPIWAEVIRLGKQAGAEAGAEWKSFKDLPHFQKLPQIADKPITLDQALARFREHGTIFTV